MLVLSHWPASPTPEAWLRDTSAEIVLDFIEAEGVPDDVQFVSNNHFDEDGLFGICALLDPEIALTRRDRFVDAATAGDFGRYRERDAARAIFTISKLVSEVPDQGDYAERTAAIYKKLLPVVPRLVDDIGQLEDACRDEDRFLDASERWVDQSLVRIEEDADHDLAIVRISEDVPSHRYDTFASGAAGPLHAMAVYSRTNKARVLFQQGRQFWFRYRYETWVKFVSEHHPLRVDLAPLCRELNELEREGATWSYDGSSNITPVMRPIEDTASSLDLDTILDRLCRQLDEDEVEWDPYRTADSGHA